MTRLWRDDGWTEFSFPLKNYVPPRHGLNLVSFPDVTGSIKMGLEVLIEFAAESYKIAEMRFSEPY
jgi:hypothetical protein